MNVIHFCCKTAFNYSLLCAPWALSCFNYCRTQAFSKDWIFFNKWPWTGQLDIHLAKSLMGFLLLVPFLGFWMSTICWWIFLYVYPRGSENLQKERHTSTYSLLTGLVELIQLADHWLSGPALSNTCQLSRLSL